jgi:hypothetical protein
MAVKIQGVPVISDLRELKNLSDGTSSTPAITFGSDTNTGIFHPAADKISISAGGVVRLEVTSSEVVLQSADINGGSIDATQIGSVTPAAASFTTVTSSGVVNSSTDITINNTSVLDTALALAIALG